MGLGCGIGRTPTLCPTASLKLRYTACGAILSALSSRQQQKAYIQQVKQVCSIHLVLHKPLQVLEYDVVHLDAIKVVDRVLAEKIELDNKFLAFILLVQFDVFHTE